MNGTKIQEKYKPTEFKDLIGNEVARKEIKKWFRLRSDKTQLIENYLFIHGPTGTGKTLTVNILSKGYNVYIYDSSKKRQSGVTVAQEIKHAIKSAGQSQNILSLMRKEKTKTLILLDNLADLTPPKITELTNVIKSAGALAPIIFITSEYKSSFDKLKKISKEVKFVRPIYEDIKKVATKILVGEKIKLDRDSAKYILNGIIEYAQNDYRQLHTILSDLLYYAKKSKKGKKKMGNKLTKRLFDDFMTSHQQTEQNLNIFEITNKIISTKMSFSECLNQCFSDTMLLPLSIHTNYLSVINRYSNSFNINSISKMADYISLGSQCSKKVNDQFEWSLQPIATSMSVCAPIQVFQTEPVIAKRFIETNGKVKFNKFDNYLLKYPYLRGKMSSLTKRRKIITELRNKMNCTEEYLKYFKSTILFYVLHEDPLYQQIGIKMAKRHKLKYIDLLNLAKIFNYNTKKDHDEIKKTKNKKRIIALLNK